MSIGCTPGIHNASPLVDALASRLWPCALRLRPHAARARRMRAATVARTSRTPRPTSSRTGQRTRRCILGRQAYVQPAARPHATLRARAPIPVDLVDRRPRANGRATTAAHSAGGKRAVDSRNVRGILRARGDRATSEPARRMWKQLSEHEACIADMSEGRGARGKAGSTCSAARAGSRPIVAHEALVTSAEVSDSMGIGRAGIHTCASAPRRERRVRRLRAAGRRRQP